MVLQLELNLENENKQKIVQNEGNCLQRHLKNNRKSVLALSESNSFEVNKCIFC